MKYALILFAFLISTMCAAAATPDASPSASAWFVGWGTLALIVSGVAQGMNRGGFFWFVMALIAGPVALAILVIICNKAPCRCCCHTEKEEDKEDEEGPHPIH